MTASARGLALGGLALITALAFVLRLSGIDQTLYADEDFTYYIVARNGLRGVWDAVYNTSITPPLHYGLAWLSLKLGGDGTVLVRLPSLLLGTALVPLVYAWARRLGDAPAALLAALLVALSPFLIWYSDEARAYATMMFLLALSTLALLHALDGRGRGWWVLHVVCACAALWSHYTALFVIVAQAAWALWVRRDLLRPVLIAQAVIALGYLPWLPGFLQQRENKGGVTVIGEFGPVDPSTIVGIPLRVLTGHPFFGLKTSPGWEGLVLAVAIAVLFASALAAVWRSSARVRLDAVLRSEIGLLAMLSLATPAGLLLYAAVGSSLWLPRNLAASVPAFSVLAGLGLAWAARRAPRPVGVASLAAILLFSAWNALQMVTDEEFRRPAFREAVEYVEQTASAKDPLVETTLSVTPDPRLPPITLDRYLDRPRPLFRARSGDGPAWRSVERDGQLYAVTPRLWLGSEFVKAQLQPGERAPSGLLRRLNRIGGPDGRALVAGRRSFEGIFPVEVLRFRGEIDGRLARTGERESIRWTQGSLTVTPAAAEGEVEGFSGPSEPLLVPGWAVDSSTGGPADWILLFAGDQLAAMTAGGLRRPDVAAEAGPRALLSGFEIAAPDVGGDESRLRVFAVVGDRASELPLTEAARAGLRLRRSEAR